MNLTGVQDARRLKVLLGAFACAVLLWAGTNNGARTSADLPTRTLSRSHSPTHSLKAVPEVRKLPQISEDTDATPASRRNPFLYADVPPTPPPAPPPPPPPPPPPEIKPESRLIGIIYQNQLLALFSLKGDVVTLKEGDILEGKYVIKRVDPDSVNLEDKTYHNVATLSLVKK
ncbi:MAG: hypothetical protein HYX75_23015 [Acidobacteria bacterium]|nr:hypothetical protein [Acidobacteriota bacterium]